MGFHDSLKIVRDQVAHCEPKSCFQLLQENLSRCLHDGEQFLEAGIQVRPHHLVYSSKLGHEKLCQDQGLPASLPLHCRLLGDGGSVFSSLLPLLSYSSPLRVGGHREEAYLQE